MSKTEPNTFIEKKEDKVIGINIELNGKIVKNIKLSYPDTSVILTTEDLNNGSSFSSPVTQQILRALICFQDKLLEKEFKFLGAQND